MKPTVGRIVIVKLVGETREMPGIVVEVEADRGPDDDGYAKIKVFHPDGDEFDPMWIVYSATGAYNNSTWRWP